MEERGGGAAKRTKLAECHNEPCTKEQQWGGAMGRQGSGAVG